MKRLILLFVALAVMTNVMAQLNPGEPIPADKEVRVGQLENGMTYYIRHNEKPKGQANFYILHNVGAIQENDAQQGLAHFLEHMAFNGTKNLPGKDMIDYLERNGVKFGADLNAFTAHDITCYNLDNVPTLKPGTIDTALLILHDWSQSISLEPAEIDNERGVIMEELRTRDAADYRAMIEQNKAVYKGSKYEQRNVIGYLDGLKSFSYDELRNFYKTWYRPEYQGIVIVGDIDVDAIEAKLKSMMSDIPASPADAPQKEAYVVPDNQEPIVSIFSDPESMASVVRIFIKRPAMPAQNNSLVIKEMIDMLDTFTSMMASNRMNEIAMQPNAPFLGGVMQIGDLLMVNPNLDLIMIGAQTRDGELLQGYQALVAEMEKMSRYGFTQGEFERAQADLLSQTETVYANRNDRTNKNYVDVYLQNYQKNTAMPDAETQYNISTQLIKGLTVNDVNAWAKQLITPANQVITVVAPKKEGLINPTEADILKVRSEVMASEITAYEDTAVTEPLIPANAKLKGSAVKTTVYNKDLGTTEWTLKNGAKVIVKPSQLKADEVLLKVTSEGGMALLPAEQVQAGELLPAIASMSGVGVFSANDLGKQLAGKNAGVMLEVNSYSNGMNGFSTPKDLETMLQLLYLNFTNPRFSKDDFNTAIGAYKAYVQNLTSSPDYIMQMEATKTLYNNNPRKQPMTVEVLDQITFESLPEIYKTLYPGANSFTFTFIGNVDLATLKPLVEKYIGSIPASKSVLKFKDDGVRKVTGKVVNDFHTPMLQPKVTELFVFSSDADYSLRNKQTLLLLNLALTDRYRASIREEKGGTYGVQVGQELSYRPKEQYVLQMSFDTNEAMADELAPVIFDELQKIAEQGPNAENIDSAREYLLKEFKNSLERNDSWFRLIDNYYRHNENAVADYATSLNSITYDDIRNVAKEILDNGNVMQLVMRPQTQVNVAQ